MEGTREKETMWKQPPEDLVPVPRLNDSLQTRGREITNCIAAHGSLHPPAGEKAIPLDRPSRGTSSDSLYKVPAVYVYLYRY